MMGLSGVYIGLTYLTRGGLIYRHHCRREAALLILSLYRIVLENGKEIHGALGSPMLARFSQLFGGYAKQPALSTSQLWNSRLLFS